TSGGVKALADGSAQIAMTSRPLTPEDRADAPDVLFNEIYVGEQVVAVAVTQDVWQGGVRTLTRAQVRDIYERRCTNWKQLGGPDQKIAFFNASEGRGVWELFAQWLYDDAKKAPLGDFPMIGSNAEARDTLEFTRGAASILSPLMIDGKAIFAIELKEKKEDHPEAPTIEK